MERFLEWLDSNFDVWLASLFLGMACIAMVTELMGDIL